MSYSSSNQKQSNPSDQQPRLVSYERRTADYNTVSSPTHSSPSRALAGGGGQSHSQSVHSPSRSQPPPGLPSGARQAQRSLSFQRRQPENNEMGSAGMRRTPNSVAPVSVDGHSRTYDRNGSMDRSIEDRRRRVEPQQPIEHEYPRFQPRSPRSPPRDQYTAFEYQSERGRREMSDMAPEIAQNMYDQHQYAQDFRNRVYEEIPYQQNEQYSPNRSHYMDPNHQPGPPINRSISSAQYGSGGPYRSNQSSQPSGTLDSRGQQQQPHQHYQQHRSVPQMGVSRRRSSASREISSASREVLQETDILDDGSEFSEDIYQAGTHAADDAASSSEGEMDDDPEFMEIQERENIINKYSEGPDSKFIDDWENPDSELFKKMDRFGFLHKDESNLTDEQREHKRRIEKEFSREKKWRNMIKTWEGLKPGDRPKKLEERIWKGIPAKLRMKVWPLLLETEQMKSVRPNTYRDLLLRARLVSKDIKQIDLDINRTYRDHEAFRRRYDVKQQSLLNVLAAYAMYNTEVGYCQGMSQIAALFLMYLDEEDSFWCLHSIMVNPRHTMHGFFVPGFPKLTRFETHFKKVLKKYKPRVYKHLEKQDIPYIYLTKWWFGCFLDRVPFPLAMRLWDVYLIEGDSILIAMSLNIMKMHEKTIRKLQIDTFMEFIQMRISENFGFSDDETMISLRETLNKLKNDRQHKAPPPSDADLAEHPTKALGPILATPLGSIREQQAEVQSRHSLAVSTGRSPYPGRKKSKQRSGSKPPQHHSSSQRLTGANGNNGMEESRISNSGSSRGGDRPSPTMIPPGREVPFEIPSRRSSQKHPHHSMNDSSSPSPADPHHNHNPSSHSHSSSVTTPLRSPSASKGNGRIPVYDSDRALCPRTASIRDERTGRTVTIVRDADDDADETQQLRQQRDISTSSTTARVTQSANHVTYISLGDDPNEAASVI